jgi:single-strand DNA-binding protein
MYQKIIIIGFCGSNPEMRYLPDGTAITNISVATSEKWSDKNTGELKEKTAWFRVSIFGRQAETAHEFLSKGSKVLVEGKLDFDSATGGPKTFSRKDGSVSTSFEIKADNVRFLSGKNDADNVSHAQETAVTETEDEVPF